MADGSCDADVLSTPENSLQLVVNNGETEQVEMASSSLACVLCAAAAATTWHLKMLPCLHLTCQDCLVQFLLDKSLPYKDSDFAASIFTCPRCSYTVQLPRDGVAGLKDASFLQTADSFAVTSDANVLSDTAGGKHASTAMLTYDISCEADVNNMSRLLGNLPQSLMTLNHSEDNDALSRHSGDTIHAAEMPRVTLVNSKQTHYCDVSSDDGLTRLGDRSQIRSLSRDVVRRQQDCKQATQQITLTAHELDARKSAVRSTISKRTDYLCKLICSRRDELFDELEREHSHSSAQYNERITAVGTYSRRLEDSSQFASAVLAAKNVSADVESDVAARLNQLILCDTQGIPGASGVPEITAMRLDIPDEQHEDSHLEKLFGSLVRGTVGAVEYLTSFNTDLQWPTGFAVTRSHDSVLAGKAGAFADKGQVLFYDSHGACVHCHTLPAGHLPIDVVTVASGEVLVSDVSGHVTKFSSSGRPVAEWSDVFQGPTGHMAVNRCNEVLVTSASDCCIHRYRETDGHRLATFALQWPGDASHTLPDITAITVNSDNEIIVTASNLRNPYFFTADGRFLHSLSTEPTPDQGVKTRAKNGVNSASIALPSAVCCDSFDNVLVADFLGNCVHLVSSSGSHLGRLLTKTHGVACPNFVTLDQDGRLYVGQYGGDVLVFRYLSCVKRV